MTTLVAVAFPDESTAGAAAEDVRQVALDVPADLEAVAVLSRGRSGRLRLTTSHEASGASPWVVAWIALVQTVFADGALDGSARREGRRRARRLAVMDDLASLHDLRDELRPRTSILLLVAAKPLSAEAVLDLTRLGGVLTTRRLRVDATGLLQAALAVPLPGPGRGRSPRDIGADPASDARPLPTLLALGGVCGSV